MDEKEKMELYQHAVDRWGTNAQLFMIFEEMSELQKAICKATRKGGQDMSPIIEEIADVEIMLEQLEFMAMISREDIERVKEQKLHRLMSMLN